MPYSCWGSRSVWAVSNMAAYHSRLVLPASMPRCLPCVLVALSCRRWPNSSLPVDISHKSSSVGSHSLISSRCCCCWAISPRSSLVSFMWVTRAVKKALSPWWELAQRRPLHDYWPIVSNWRPVLCGERAACCARLMERSMPFWLMKESSRQHLPTVEAFCRQHPSRESQGRPLLGCKLQHLMSLLKRPASNRRAHFHSGGRCCCSLSQR